MDKLFPSMNSKPKKIVLFAIIPCWLWVFVLLPTYMPIIGLGICEQAEMSVWLDIAYHVMNGILMLFLISGYLKDEWFMVTTNVRYYLKHVALTVGLIIGAELLLIGIPFVCGLNIDNMLESLPLVEMDGSHTPLSLIIRKPIFGTAALSIFTPITVCSFFYCFGFAPICYNNPWLAYLCVAVVTLIPPVIDIIWRGDAPLMLIGYLVHLPVHLLACWSYQKTDNVWTPIITVAVTNLLLSIFLLIYYI